MVDRGEQLWEIVKDAADHMTRSKLQARIAALEAQLAEREKALDSLSRLAEKQKAYHNAKQHEFPSIEQCVDEDGVLRPAQNLYALLQGEAANGRYSEADWWLCTIRAEIDALSALEATPPAPKVTTGPVPTHECEFSIGQPVQLANPYAEDDPTTIYFVTGIRWEHRQVSSRGWDIAIATAEELRRGYGQTDGFAPSDLTAALSGDAPKAREAGA